MHKIKNILIGTNNKGKYKEICDLLSHEIKKYSLKDFNIDSPEETGKSFEENSLLKAKYFSEKTNMVCISDDSGLEINLLDGAPGIYSSRWGGSQKDFNLAIEKVFKKMNEKKINWQNENNAKFICCMTIFWPDGKSFSSKGIIEGKISPIKKGQNGFGYDPIFIPDGHNLTFGEMIPKMKMSIDHRFKAFAKIKKFFI